MKIKQAPGGNFFDRLRSKLRYNVVNVIEAFVVSLIFLLNFMLVQILNSQTILQRRQVVENLNITQNNATAVIVCVAKQ